MVNVLTCENCDTQNEKNNKIQYKIKINADKKRKEHKWLRKREEKYTEILLLVEKYHSSNNNSSYSRRRSICTQPTQCE